MTTVPVETKILFVGLLVGLAHIACGVAVLVQPSSALVAPVELLRVLIASLGYGSGVVGATLLFAGILAVVASSKGIQTSKRIRVCLFMPQQLLLLLQIGSVSLALGEGVYPDGYAPDGGGWFILADQVWAWVLAVSHSVWLMAFIYGSADRGMVD